MFYTPCYMLCGNLPINYLRRTEPFCFIFCGWKFKILIFIYKEKQMKDLRQFIKTTIREFLNEENKYDVVFTKKQQLNAKNLFKEIFDVYLRKVSPKTYPMIYHNTNIENHENIKKYGLTNKLNYFLEYDNDINAYGADDNPGIACGVNYKDVIDRLYPDPEWLLSIIKKIGNPSYFSERKIDDSYILCLVVEDILKLDLNTNLTITDVSNEKMDFMTNDNMFAWLYVKGEVSPNLITITIHPDFIQ